MTGDSPNTRRLILLYIAVFIAGGVWKARSSLQVDRSSPQLDALANATSATGVAQALPHPHPELACSPRLQLAITQLAADMESLLDGDQLCMQHLQPALAAWPLLPPVNLTASSLLHPPPHPPSLLRRLHAAYSPASSLATQPGLLAEALGYASQLQQLVQDMHQLPAPTAHAGVAAVLVVHDEPVGEGAAGTALGASAGAAGSSGAAGLPILTAVQLQGEGALAVFVTAGAGVAGAAAPDVQRGTMRQLAAIVADWLGQAVQPAQAQLAAPQQVGGAAGSQPGAAELAAACVVGAGAQLQQFRAALRTLPGMAVSADLPGLAVSAAHAVHQAQQAAEQGQPMRALRLARAAWGGAWGVQHHPGFGVEPVFPQEHQLALILPLALPVGLVVVRAVAWEVREWRQGRRAAAVARSRKSD